MTGQVINIQRFCVDDGPGIRTGVFLKGCPLKCAWCHNPESQLKAPQIMFYESKCVNCGLCQGVCENNCHTVTALSHGFKKDNCVHCGACVSACPNNALELCGREMSADEIINIVLRDLPFYRDDGGITITGGEPLMQWEFSCELARMAKQSNISVCVETSGYGSINALTKLSKYTDIFYFDCKLIDPKLHKKYTGVSNELILNNLRTLSDLGASIVLRCPIIPNINQNNSHFEAIARLAKDLDGIKEINLLPYHPLGLEKHKRLFNTPTYNNPEFLKREALIPIAEKIYRASQKPTTVK